MRLQAQFSPGLRELECDREPLPGSSSSRAGAIHLFGSPACNCCPSLKFGLVSDGRRCPLCCLYCRFCSVCCQHGCIVTAVGLAASICV